MEFHALKKRLSILIKNKMKNSFLKRMNTLKNYKNVKYSDILTKVRKNFALQLQNYTKHKNILVDTIFLWNWWNA